MAQDEDDANILQYYYLAIISTQSTRSHDERVAAEPTHCSTCARHNPPWRSYNKRHHCKTPNAGLDSETDPSQPVVVPPQWLLSHQPFPSLTATCGQGKGGRYRKAYAGRTADTSTGEAGQQQPGLVATQAAREASQYDTRRATPILFAQCRPAPAPSLPRGTPRQRPRPPRR